jgi:hypothetical protein
MEKKCLRVEILKRCCRPSRDINGSSEIGNHIILMGNSRRFADIEHKERSGMRSYFYTAIVVNNCYGAIRHYIYS